MPSLRKLLSRFDKEERKTIESLLVLVVSLDWRGLDVKKLKGHDSIYRVRKGKNRVIFSKEKKDILILSIDRRSDTT